MEQISDTLKTFRDAYNDAMKENKRLKQQQKRNRTYTTSPPITPIHNRYTDSSNIDTPPREGLDTERKQTQQTVIYTTENRISQLADDTQPIED